MLFVCFPVTLAVTQTYHIDFNHLPINLRLFGGLVSIPGAPNF